MALRSRAAGTFVLEIACCQPRRTLVSALLSQGCHPLLTSCAYPQDVFPSSRSTYHKGRLTFKMPRICCLPFSPISNTWLWRARHIVSCHYIWVLAACLLAHCGPVLGAGCKLHGFFSHLARFLIDLYIYGQVPVSKQYKRHIF